MEWTQENIAELLELKSRGIPRDKIATIIGRTESAVAIKLKRLKKKNNTYNASHAEEKKKINIEFEEFIKPETILNLYAGNENYYKAQTIRNDKNPAFNTEYHMDALKLICRLYSENKKFDFIDLDPYGSAYDLIDLAIKMAQKGIAITLGELGHKRFKRLDFVKPRYNITTLEEFTIDNIIKKIQQIGDQNKKHLIIYTQKEWKNIGRVWFEIKPKKGEPND